MAIIPQKSASTIIVDTVLSGGVELFPEPLGVAWAGLPGANGYIEYTPLNSGKFKRWVARGFYSKFGKIPGNKAIDDAILTLSGLADQNPPRRVYLRVAYLGDRVIFDLGDKFVDITGDGWQLTTTPAVPFKRPAGQLALPLPNPQNEKRFDSLLADLTGLMGEKLTLVTGFTIGTLGPGDYPILALSGEQGTGKSTLAELIKRIVDPNEVNLKSPPRDAENLSVAASNSWLLAFDNLSSIPDWLSDGLCRVSSGTGYSTRKFYANDEEVLIKHWRPIIVNGIPELASRGDLADRLISITLDPLEAIEEKAALWARFESMLPDILAALFDCAAMALRNRDARLTNTPRLADFAHWVEAALPATWLGSGDFVKTYLANREESAANLLDLSVIGAELEAFSVRNPNWCGSARELLDKLTLSALGTPAGDALKKLSPRGLSNELRRLAPLLRHAGITVEFSDKTSRVNGRVVRPITITNLAVGAQVNVP